ncbi:MYXO-CTERM sorting domain-containing protein [Zoogloea sp.]|uniref:MYXO-CTERM sorting domain-containing protein n=1 Tax=Zoogloea sp. TaxID=49181 RepID=UPI0035B323C2
MAALNVPASAATSSVDFIATDLTDVTTGRDLWHYKYLIKRQSLPSLFAVNLIFSPSLYGNLTVTGFSSGLSVLDTQPDPGLPADGLIIATALYGAVFDGSETVDLDFVWLGNGDPESQYFEILDDSFNIVLVAQTAKPSVPPPQSLPEPGVAGLVALGMLALRRRRRV